MVEEDKIKKISSKNSLSKCIKKLIIWILIISILICAVVFVYKNYKLMLEKKYKDDFYFNKNFAR